MARRASSHDVVVDGRVSATDLRAAIQALICLALAVTFISVGAASGTILVAGIGLLLVVMAAVNAREIGRR
jgi:hypothetical protein